MATKLPSNPTNILEKIICDADLHHLSSENYFTRSELLKNEIERTKHVTIPVSTWNNENILFFLKHRYFTKQARAI